MYYGAVAAIYVPFKKNWTTHGDSENNLIDAMYFGAPRPCAWILSYFLLRPLSGVIGVICSGMGVICSGMGVISSGMGVTCSGRKVTCFGMGVIRSGKGVICFGMGVICAGMCVICSGMGVIFYRRRVDYSNNRVTEELFLSL
jgi:hypothetical protein